jgi:hypothetical protein
MSRLRVAWAMPEAVAADFRSAWPYIGPCQFAASLPPRAAGALEVVAQVVRTVVGNLIPPVDGALMD